MSATTATPGLLAVWNDIAAEDEAEFNAWYVEEHVPERLDIPGILTARRYRDAAAPLGYAAIYDTASLAALTAPASRAVGTEFVLAARRRRRAAKVRLRRGAYARGETRRHRYHGAANCAGEPSMRVLLVEDDPMIGEGVRTALRQDGYAVDWTRDGKAADLALQAERYDLVLLDLGLPSRSGLEVLRAMRARKDATPVLIVTAHDAVRERVGGLDAGADDYLVKPFDLDELVARMRSLLRRSAGRAEPVIEHGELVLNPATREVTLRNAPVNLSARELAVLQALLERPGAVLSRAQLEERLYGWGEEIESNAVEVYVHGLRRKLGADFIRTVRGVGYMVPKAR